MDEPRTTEGQRLKDWMQHDSAPTPAVLSPVQWSGDQFDQVAAVVLDHPDRYRLPATEELLVRLEEALRKEVGGMFHASDDDWRKAARAMLTRMGIHPIGLSNFSLEPRDHPRSD